MVEIEKNWNNDINILSLRKKNYFVKYDFYNFKIYFLLFISLIILSILIVQETNIALFIVGITLSSIIAYKFPKTAIVLTILLGQVIQFETRRSTRYKFRNTIF